MFFIIIYIYFIINSLFCYFLNVIGTLWPSRRSRWNYGTAYGERLLWCEGRIRCFCLYDTRDYLCWWGKRLSLHHCSNEGCYQYFLDVERSIMGLKLFLTNCSICKVRFHFSNIFVCNFLIVHCNISICSIA